MDRRRLCDLLACVTSFLPNERAFRVTHAAKTHSTKEVESPLSVLLLDVSVRFARLLAALPHGTTGDLPNRRLVLIPRI